MRNRFFECIVCASIGMLLLLACTYPILVGNHDLVFLPEDAIVTSVATHMEMTAVVTAEGNCFLRGPLVSDEIPFGVTDIPAYCSQYSTLNLDKANRLVQIYSGGDAETISLSDTGGTIISRTQELYLFSDAAPYRTPQFFCTGVIAAKLYRDRVFVLTTDNTLGYYEITKPSEFVALKTAVTEFIITDLDGRLWYLTDGGELWTSEPAKTIDTGICLFANVLRFDVLCTNHYPDILDPEYVLCYMVEDGSVYSYSGNGLPTQETVKQIVTVSSIADVYTYAGGIILLDDEDNATVYGNELVGNKKYDGVMLAPKVRNISTSSLCINIVTEQKKLLSCGHLPNSSLVCIEEIIAEE